MRGWGEAKGFGDEDVLVDGDTAVFLRGWVLFRVVLPGCRLWAGGPGSVPVTSVGRAPASCPRFRQGAPFSRSTATRWRSSPLIHQMIRSQEPICSRPASVACLYTYIWIGADLLAIPGECISEAGSLYGECESGLADCSFIWDLWRPFCIHAEQIKNEEGRADSQRNRTYCQTR